MAPINTEASVFVRDLGFTADVITGIHCHHYALWHDQTITDALGHGAGTVARTRASMNAFAPLLRNLMFNLDITNPMQIARDLMPRMGLGKLDVGHVIEGSPLFHSATWMAKYPKEEHAPLDALIAGVVAAATAMRDRKDQRFYTAYESHCVAEDGQQPCEFSTHILDKPQPTWSLMPPSMWHELTVDTPEGMQEDRIVSLKEALLLAFRGWWPDEVTGLANMGGLYVARFPLEYFVGSMYESLHFLESTRPDVTDRAEDMFMESGTVCGWHTFGGMLNNPEAAAYTGTISKDPESIVVFACAMARAIGLGRWAISEFEPGQRLVLVSGSNHEEPFYIRNYGVSGRPRAYVFAGAALSAMMLAHDVAWDKGELPTQNMYDHRRSKLRWRVRQTKCRTMGADLSEITITAK